jgi:hypothetical protein
MKKNTDFYPAETIFGKFFSLRVDGTGMHQHGCARFFDTNP